MTFGQCWNCDGTILITRPDEGMDGVTDETVCAFCGEVQET